MKMKRVALFVVFSVFMLLSSICFAKVSTYDLEIGGIYYKQPMADVLKFCGDSIRTEHRAPAGYNFTFLVDGSEIKIGPSTNQEVVSASIMGNSKLLTNRNIGLGYTLAELIKAYGKPDIFRENTYNKTFDAIYYTENNNSFIYFSLNQDNIIDCIGYDIDLGVR